MRDPCFCPDSHEQKTVKQNKTQKKKLTEGAKIVNRQDDAIWSALTDRVPCGREIMLASIVFTGAFLVSSGHMREIVDPGVNGLGCSAGRIEQLSCIMDEVDPASLSAYVPYENDDFACDSENNLSNLPGRSRDRGRRLLFLIHCTVNVGMTRIL